jgi:hypothetical protein
VIAGKSLLHNLEQLLEILSAAAEQSARRTFVYTPLLLLMCLKNPTRPCKIPPAAIFGISFL